jgi:hypothetical protein
MSRAASPAPVLDRPGGHPTTGMGGGRFWEPPALAAVLLLALFARRPGYLLSQTFWVDEGWVADAVRAPLKQLTLLTSSTPIGWSLLLRAVPPVGGLQYLRLLPLAFAVASVVPAWWLGRRVGGALGRAGPTYAVAAGLAAAIVPTGLARHDLKQYTADACLTLVLVLAAARLEATWTRGRREAKPATHRPPAADGRSMQRNRSQRRYSAGPLATFAAACVLAFPFSNVTPFVAAGLFAGLAVATAARRTWRRLAGLTVAAVAVGLTQGAFYRAVVSAGDNPAIRAYWSHWYVPNDQGLGVAADFASDRVRHALGSLGLGPWPVAGVLVGLGLVALVRAGLGGVALASPLLAAALVVAGALHRYPLLEERTSLFVTTLWMVLAALGLVWLADQLTRWRTATVLAVVLVVAVAAGLVPTATKATARPLPAEDVHAAVEYILDRRQPGDVVIASYLDAYPFAWYWPDQPSFVPTRAPTAVRFQVEYPPGGVIVARWSDAAAIDEALGQLAARTRRVWLVVVHATAGQRTRWLRRLAKLGASTRTPVDGLVLAELPAERP